jgi:chromatin modification-related protein VID21
MFVPPKLSFLLSFSANQGSIANFKDDFSFPDRLPLQPSKSDFPLTSNQIESAQETTNSLNESMVTVDPREDIVIPIPLKPTGHVYHIDALAPPKSLEHSISPVHYLQQYDPQYKLPPLSVLPPEFSRKIKSTKRKKERERDKLDGKKDKDEVLPMGVNRWEATLHANPVWKKVSRATKCLSSREWGVCLHSCPYPEKIDDTLNRLP